METTQTFSMNITTLDGSKNTNIVDIVDTKSPFTLQALMLLILI